MHCVLLLTAPHQDTNTYSVFVYKVGDIISCNDEPVEIQLFSVHDSQYQAENSGCKLVEELKAAIAGDGLLKVTAFPRLNIVLAIKTDEYNGESYFDRKLLRQRFICHLSPGEELIVLLITPSRKTAKRLYRDPVSAIAQAYTWRQLITALPVSTMHATSPIAEA